MKAIFRGCKTAKHNNLVFFSLAIFITTVKKSSEVARFPIKEVFAIHSIFHAIYK